MQPTVVKTSKPSEFLALVPELVGFQPENSIALVAFRGRRTCGALRFTLPDSDGSPTLHKRIATTIVGMACKLPGVDALVPVVYTDERFAGLPTVPHESFIKTLIQRCELSGFVVRDAFCVAADGWASYDDPDCPDGGRPLSDLSASTLTAAIPEEHRKPLGSLTSWADLPDVGLVDRERTAKLVKRYQSLASNLGSAPELVEMIGDILDPVATAEVVLTWDADAVEVADAAALLFLVQSPANRDQMMLQFAFGEDVGSEAFEVNARYAALQRATGLSMDEIVREEMELRQRDTGGAGHPAQVLADQTSDLLMGLGESRPDPVRIEAAIAVLKTVVAMAPRSARPAPFCMLAWLSWALGRGSVAGIFIDHALAIDPHYGMAQLLDTLLGTGHLPEWAFAVPTGVSAP